MSRADEIAQGLRDENGALVGGLDVAECVKAQDDFEAGRAPPRITSASYDVWRARLAREAYEEAEFRAKLRAESLARRERVRETLIAFGRPDALAEFDAQMALIDAGRS